MNKLDPKLQEAVNLENKARDLRNQAYEEKRRVEMRKKEEFKKTVGVDVYLNDDYAGLSTPNSDFYYGYEVTCCPKHGLDAHCRKDLDCDSCEWAFQAKVKGMKTVTIPRSQLSADQNEEPVFYLLAGIGIFLKNYATNS